MGSAASKPATPVPTYTAPPVKYDEKRSAVSQVQVYRQMEDDRSASGTTEMGLTRSKLDAWQQDFDATPTLKLSQLILTNADPKTSLISRERIIQDQPVFNLELKGVPDKDGKNRKGVYPGPVTNQKASGRCWLFATTNCLRYRVIPQLNLGDFQLSQSYLFFYDKLEKANWFLENVLDLVDEPIDSRIMEFLNRDPVGDGGQFDMAVNIVEKYGVVPQAVYPESFTSSQSGPINQIVTSKLREFGLELRQIVDSLRSSSTSVSKERATERARTRKDEMMRTVFDVLSCSMGTPPKPDAEFFWETYDRDGKYLKVEMTPKAFYKKYTGPYRPNECFSLINDPRNEYEKLYTVDRLGNVSGGMSVRYVNAPTSALEKAVIACIKADQPVFFGSDAGAPGIRADGIWDTKAFDYQKAYGFSLGMNKAQRLQTGDSLANHAMVITAVHLDDNGTPVRYKIENSWSDAVGNKGFFMCTADWFREYVYQVVIPEKLAESKWVEILKKGDPVVLKPWDPMGALA